MISKKRFAEIEAELKDIQKGCSARVYNIEEIAQIIEEAELKIKKFPRWMFPYLTFSQTKAATINYFGSPQATYISIIFNKSGTAKDIKIIRKNAKRQQYGGSIKGFVLDEQALLNHFDVEKLSIKLSRYLYHSLGFSSRGYVNIK